MSRGLRVTPRARQDLVEIARYTKKVWGTAQRDRYLAELEGRLQWIAANPQLGRPRPEIDPRYRSFPQGVHVIFYIVDDTTVDIVGVVHQAQDLRARFHEEP